MGLVIGDTSAEATVEVPELDVTLEVTTDGTAEVTGVVTIDTNPLILVSSLNISGLTGS